MEILPRCPKCGMKYYPAKGTDGRCPHCASKRGAKRDDIAKNKK